MNTHIPSSITHNSQKVDATECPWTDEQIHKMWSIHTMKVVAAVRSLSPIRLSCNPMDCSPPGSSVHGISQARLLEWVAIPFSQGSFPPKDQTRVSCSASRFSPLSHQGLLGLKKEGNSDTSHNTNEPGGHYAQRNKPDTEGQVMCVFTYMRTTVFKSTETDSRMVGARGWGRRRAGSVYGDKA